MSVRLVRNNLKLDVSEDSNVSKLFYSDHDVFCTTGRYDEHVLEWPTNTYPGITVSY